MTLLIMAAGNGSRYGALKQFDGLGPSGAFIMEYSMYDAIESGIKHIVIVTKKENQADTAQHFATRLPQDVTLDVVAQELTDLPEGIAAPLERKKPWGTAHAVWAARHVIDGPFVVINADDFYGREAFRAAADFMRGQDRENAFAIVAYALGGTLSTYGSVSRGICSVENGQLVSVEEHLSLQAVDQQVVDEPTGHEFSLDTPVSMNFWICRPMIFGVIEEQIRGFFTDEAYLTSEVYIPKMIAHLLETAKIDVAALQTNSPWFGVTYAEDKQDAQNRLAQYHREGLYPETLWVG